MGAAGHPSCLGCPRGDVGTSAWVSVGEEQRTLQAGWLLAPTDPCAGGQGVPMSLHGTGRERVTHGLGDTTAPGAGRCPRDLPMLKMPAHTGPGPQRPPHAIQAILHHLPLGVPSSRAGGGDTETPPSIPAPRRGVQGSQRAAASPFTLSLIDRLRATGSIAAKPACQPRHPPPRHPPHAAAAPMGLSSGPRRGRGSITVVRADQADGGAGAREHGA